jgi:PKHD-type hydroxylase
MQHLRNVLTSEELTAVTGALAVAEFEDGKLTADDAIKHVKKNLQLKRDGPEPIPLDTLVVGALARHPVLRAWGMPRRFAAPLYSKYEPGMAYGAHVDASVMGIGNPIRADLSFTLFLSPPTDYDGGELAIETSAGSHRVKLPAGDAIVYSTYELHQVLPVTRGARLVAVTWAQSLVRDPRMRQILFDLNVATQSLTEKAPDALEVKLLQRALSNLQRCQIES